MPHQDDDRSEGLPPPRYEERLGGDRYHRPTKPSWRAVHEDNRDVSSSPSWRGHLGIFSRILGSDPAVRKLMWCALFGIFLLVAVGGVWSLFVSRPHGIPVIGPPPYAVKDKPDDPGGMLIMSDDTAHSDVSGKGTVHLAPPPEQPDMNMLAGREEGSLGEDHTAESASAVSHQAHSPLSSGDTKPPTIDPSNKEEGGDEGVYPSQEDTTHAQAASPSQDIEHAHSVGDASHSSIASQQKLDSDKISSSQEAQQSVHEPSKKDITTERDAEASAPKGREVQLAALESEEQARREWSKLKKQAPDLLEGHTPIFQPASRGGKTFIRVRLGGFEDFKAARIFCAHLHAQSLACSVVAF